MERFPLVCAGMLLVAVMGCRHDPEIRMQDPPPTFLSPSRAEVAPSGARTVSLGKSVRNRSMDLVLFGGGERPILIMGGIHGDERTSVYVAEHLRDELKQHAATNPVAILAIANPDGFAADTRTNSRGVDLNRNFPATNWHKGRGRQNYGGEALSEPESNAILKAIDTLNPRLIISIHCIGENRHCNNYDGPAESIAKLMSGYNHYPVTATMGYPTPGSLGSFAGIDRKIPIITLELPRAASGEKAWTDNREALRAAIEAAR